MTRGWTFIAAATLAAAGLSTPALSAYAALNGIDGMRKIPQMSLRHILPVDHSCVHYCELKANEICEQSKKIGVGKKECIDRQFELCLFSLKYGDC